MLVYLPPRQKITVGAPIFILEPPPILKRYRELEAKEVVGLLVGAQRIEFGRLVAMVEGDE